MVQLQPQGWCHPALLGMDVLGSDRCDFHFAGSARIDLDVQRPDPVWFPLTTDSHRTPTVEMQWDEMTLAAIWDTGAGVTLVDQSWADRHPTIIAVGAESGRGTDVTGTESGHPWGTMAACRIGGVGFAEQTCGIIDFSAMNAALSSPIEVIIGLPLIAQASWRMDFPGRRWALLP